MTIQTLRYSCLGWNFPFNIRNTELRESIVGIIPAAENDGHETSFRFVTLGDDKARLDTFTTGVNGREISNSTFLEGNDINTAGPKDRIWRWVPGKEK